MTQPKDLRRTLELVRRDKWAHLDIPWFLEELLNRIEALEAQTPSESTTPEPCSHPVWKLTPVKVENVAGKLCMVLECSCRIGYFSLPWTLPEDD